MAGPGADLSYPVAGLLVSFLEERLGRKDLMALYLKLSGSYDEIAGLDKLDIEEAICNATGHGDWLDLTVDLDQYLDRRLEREVAAVPGLSATGRELAVGDGFHVAEDDEWFSFQFTAVGLEAPKGTLLFGYMPELAELQSPLFDEQYQRQQDFQGFRFGLRFDQHEAGLYDFAANQLMAKYIWGIAPSPDYYDADANTISIRFRRHLVDSDQFGKGRVRLMTE
jgi:hypothetical protein